MAKHSEKIFVGMAEISARSPSISLRVKMMSVERVMSICEEYDVPNFCVNRVNNPCIYLQDLIYRCSGCKLYGVFLIVCRGRNVMRKVDNSITVYPNKVERKPHAFHPISVLSFCLVYEKHAGI